MLKVAGVILLVAGTAGAELRIEGNTIYVPEGRTVLKKPLNLRGKIGWRVHGEGLHSVIEADFGEAGARWPVVDMTGAYRCILESFRIVGNNTGCGLLQARKDYGSSSQHFVRNVTIEGNFNLAALCNFASEVNTYDHCYFSGGEKGHCVVLGNGLRIREHPGRHPFYRAIMSPYADAPEWPAGYASSTMQQGRFRDCHFSNHGAAASAIKIYSNEGMVVSDWHFEGGGISQSHPSLAAIEIAIPGRTGQVYNVTFDSMRFETSGPRYTLYVHSDAHGRNVSNVAVTHCFVDAAETAFKFDTSTRNGPMLFQGNFVPHAPVVYEANRSYYVRLLGNTIINSSVTYRVKTHAEGDCVEGRRGTIHRAPESVDVEVREHP